MTYKNKEKIRNISLFVLKVLVAFIFIIPLYWSILVSFRPDDKILSDSLNLLPTSFTLDHYKYVFQVGGLWGAIGNTLIMTLFGLVLNLLFCSIAGYAFARLKFKGNNTIFKILLAGMMIPGIVTLLPSLLIIEKLGLYGTWLGVILPGAAGIFNIFMLRQFFLTLPKELGESAKIDGANEFQIFYKIYLPLVAPALATITIFTFQGNWNSFMWPYLILRSDQLVITTFVKNIEAQNNIGTAMAASTIATIPLIIIFLFFQKYFTQGVAASGIKE